jgi:TRAP-type uncharacterized transport system substrate-binding protein
MQSGRASTEWTCRAYAPCRQQVGPTARSLQLTNRLAHLVWGFPAMAAQFSLVKVLWKWVAPIAGLTALGLALYFYFHSPTQRSYRLRLTAGNELGTRHQLAMHFQSEAVQQNLAFDLVPSAGSEQALDWVNTRKVDVALVQGGLTADGRSNVRQVATLHVEPMHLLVKKELFRDTASSLAALRGRTIDLGEIGSGTHSLATAILDFVGLQPRDRDPTGGYIPLSVNRQHLQAEHDTARLPDAVFLVSSLPSATSAYLLIFAKRSDTPGFRTVHCV